MGMDVAEKKRSSRSFRSQQQQQQQKRSKRIMLLSSESISAECVAITAYERLSRSVRLSDELTGGHRQKSKARLFLGRFNFGQQKQHADTAKEGEEKKTRSGAGGKSSSRWSSWLPDPDRRWPVQGWWIYNNRERWRKHEWLIDRCCYSLEISENLTFSPLPII